LIGPICNDPQFIQLVQKLKNDPSKDVKTLIQTIEIPDHLLIQHVNQSEERKEQEEVETGNFKLEIKIK